MPVNWVIIEYHKFYNLHELDISLFFSGHNYNIVLRVVHKMIRYIDWCNKPLQEKLLHSDRQYI